MAIALETAPTSKGALWTGRVLSVLATLFLLFDGTVKLFKPGYVVDKTIELGYHDNVIIPLGIVLIGCTLLYVFARTAVLGAILLTGYLGGAVATHVRVSDPLFDTFFPVIFGGLVWGGLCLRDRRLRALVFSRK